MKRFFTILITALLLTGALCVSASASSFDEAAAELSAIGVFRGTASGFQLDQAPTRAQAAIMLVRLYGAEEEAKAAYDAGELTCTFADVGETAAPYVAWLADKGLANGVSADSFGAANPCTTKAYTVFLLRALGYKDGTDFAFADAESFAAAMGLANLSLSGTFLRDHLAALTYQALGCDLKDGSTYLLDSLIKSGAIDAEAAKPITDKIETYRALQSVTAETMKGCLDTDFDMKMNVTSNVKGQSAGTPLDASESMDMSGTGNAKVILDSEKGDLQMAMIYKVTADGETLDESGYWIKDGKMYVQSGELGYVRDIPEMTEVFQATAMSDQSSAILLPYLKSATAKTSGTDTIYTLTLNNALGSSMLDIGSLLAAEFGADFDIQISMEDSNFTYTVAKDGQLKNAAVALNADAAIAMKMNSDESEQAAFKISMKMDMNMKVKATGDAVKITYPDFSGFLEA